MKGLSQASIQKPYESKPTDHEPDQQLPRDRVAGHVQSGSKYIGPLAAQMTLGRYVQLFQSDQVEARVAWVK